VAQVHVLKKRRVIPVIPQRIGDCFVNGADSSLRSTAYNLDADLSGGGLAETFKRPADRLEFQVRQKQRL